MNYRRLGNSGLNVSTLCLGTMTFGEPDDTSMMHQVGCDEKTSHAIMSHALDAGVNFWDTADVYGNDGLTEKIIGRWFSNEKRRDEVVLATKFRFKMNDGPNGAGAHRHRIVHAVEASLKRLQTDRIDLYQVHCQDMNTPEEETLRALDDLVRAGKVLYIGASNYAGYRIAEASWISRVHNLSRYISLQPQYSLVVRDIEREVVPACEKHGLGIIPWSPLAGGFLTGKYSKDDAPPEGTRLDKKRDWLKSYDKERNWKTLDALRGVAKELDATPAQVALAWLIHKPYVSSAIFGARSIEQLDDNLKAAEISIPDSLMERLDEASRPDIGYPYSMIGRVNHGRW